MHCKIDYSFCKNKYELKYTKNVNDIMWGRVLVQKSPAKMK